MMVFRTSSFMELVEDVFHQSCTQTTGQGHSIEFRQGSFPFTSRLVSKRTELHADRYK
jgi:hypothetical protein